MTLISVHAPGMPCMIDTSVRNEREREGLIAFYQEVFGWIFEVGTADVGFYSLGYSNGQPVLGISQGPGGDGQMITYFSTPDINASIERVKDQGGQVVMAPVQIMELGSTAIVTDSIGAVHGLWQPEKFVGLGLMYEPNSPGWFDHVSENPVAAAAYYLHVLSHGIELHQAGEMDVLKRGEQWFASLSKDDSSVNPPHWTPVFVVDSLERIRDLVPKLGGTIIVEEMPVPGSAICVFQEPIMGSYMTVMAMGSNQI